MALVSTSPLYLLGGYRVGETYFILKEEVDSNKVKALLGVEEWLYEIKPHSEIDKFKFCFGRNGKLYDSIRNSSILEQFFIEKKCENFSYRKI